jgi:hypothetical protein
MLKTKKWSVLSLLIFTVFLFSNISQAQIYFGRVPVNSVNRQTTYIYNNTNTRLNFRNQYNSGQYLFTNHNCFAGLEIGQSCMVQVQYWPTQPGYHMGYIDFSFADKNNMFYGKSISVQGEAYR